jgi:branched-chain amino acid transport system permease protein
MGQLLVSGLAIGCIYSLASLGFVITYKSVGILNFAYGEMITLAAYFAATYVTSMGAPVVLGLVMVLISMIPIGMGFAYLVYRPLRNKPVRTVVIATIGVSIALQALALIIWGPYPKSVPTLGGSKPLHFGGVALLPHNLYIFGITIVVLLLLYLLYARTSLGWKMQAIAQDAEAARLMGINVDFIIMFTWVLSAGLAGLAGFLLAPLFFVTTTTGFAVMLKAFAACIIGGFGSLQGAVVGGLFVGVAETLLAGYVSSAYKDVLTFALLIVVLIVLPQGLFGEKIGEKV